MTQRSPTFLAQTTKPVIPPLRALVKTPRSCCVASCAHPPETAAHTRAECIPQLLPAARSAPEVSHAPTCLRRAPPKTPPSASLRRRTASPREKSAFVPRRRPHPQPLAH